MAIEVSGLTKDYRTPVKQPGMRGAIRHLFDSKYEVKRVVDSVSFHVDAGEAVAYIGPNGAGKSTTVKMMTGILHPTAGSISINGVDPYKDRIKNAYNIGVVFGQRTQLWWDIPIEESFRLLKDIYDIPEGTYSENIALFTEVFGLSEFISRPARHLSLGQRMRADLAASLLHNPPILFLDEPTIGLDITIKENMRELIRRINLERGTTVILTSHDLQDVEDLCRRVIVIDGGKLICDAGFDELKARFAQGRTIRVKLARPTEIEDLKLSEHPSLSAAVSGDSQFDITFPHDRYTAIEIVGIVSAHAEITDFELSEPDIKTVIERIYRSELAVS